MTVRGLEDMGQIRRIEIIKREGCHSICRVEIAAADEGYALWLRDKTGAAVTVENEEQILMRGVVKDIAGCVTYLGITLTVTVISSSSHLDKTAENRIFQSPDKTYRQVMEWLSSENVVIEILDQEFACKREPGVLIQNGETDFAFVHRIAKENGFSVFVDDTNRKKILIHIAKSVPGIVRDIPRREIKTLEFAVSADETALKLRLNSLLDLGSLVRVDGYEYVIMGCRLTEENGTVSCDYELRKCSNRDREIRKNREAVRLGWGIVVSNEDPEHMGRIQVVFQDLEDCVTGGFLWIPYLGNLTEKGGGVLLFPDRGECVEVLCQAGECVALGCVRTIPIDKDCQNTADRIIRLRGKKMVMKEELLSVSCGAARINLNEEAIQLQADSRIDVKAGRINMDGGEKVSVKTAAFDVG